MRVAKVVANAAAKAGVDRYLLIGEADFSYTRFIVEKKLVEPKNVFTTCLEKSEDVLLSVHPGAKFNLKRLRLNGVVNINYSVNALFLSSYPPINHFAFKTIQFNLPHHPEINPFQKKVHQTLIFKFLLQCHSLLAEDGRVRILHRSSYPYSTWDIETIANALGLRLDDYVPFQKSDFKTYTPRKGFGNNRNELFEISDAYFNDFKFGGGKKEPAATGIKEGRDNDFKTTVSPLVMNLADKMLLFDPSKSISVEDAVSQAFLQSLAEINEKGLEKFDYVDNTKNRERYTEQGDAITFESELLGSLDDSDPGFLVKQLPQVPTKIYQKKFSNASPIVMDLAEKMLVSDPCKRISVEDVVNLNGNEYKFGVKEDGNNDVDPVFGDYARNLPNARESEVLSLFGTIINRIMASLKGMVWN